MHPKHDIMFFSKIDNRRFSKKSKTTCTTYRMNHTHGVHNDTSEITVNKNIFIILLNHAKNVVFSSFLKFHINILNQNTNLYSIIIIL